MRLDSMVVLFTLNLAVAAGVGFGLAPALSAAGAGLREALQQLGGAAGGQGRRSARRLGGGGLVVLETALATMLLLGASLLLRSFWQLLHVDPGFDSAGVLSLSITMPDARTLGPDHGSRYSGAILERLRALPGVVAAGASHTLPLAGGGEPHTFAPVGAATPREVAPAGGIFFVSSGYFRALGVPVVAGRDFDRRDDDGTAPPASRAARAPQRSPWIALSRSGSRRWRSRAIVRWPVERSHVLSLFPPSRVFPAPPAILASRRGTLADRCPTLGGRRLTLDSRCLSLGVDV